MIYIIWNKKRLKLEQINTESMLLLRIYFIGGISVLATNI